MGLLACAAGRSVWVGCEGEKGFPLRRSAQAEVVIGAWVQYPDLELARYARVEND